MSASRDHSQGFGFVYDPSKAVQRALMEKIDGPIAIEPEKIINVPASLEVKAQNLSAIEQIQKNLEHLQGLHNKLHDILAELDKTIGGKKR